MIGQKQNKYAIIMTATGGMLPGVNAIINGLDYYENKIDFFLIGDDEIKNYVEQEIPKAKDLIVNVRFIHIKEVEKLVDIPDTKRSGWRVRFFRYKIAELYASEYSAVMIVDADMILLNNIMRYFELAEASDLLILPHNSWGVPVERIKEIAGQQNIEILRGASSPPFHNMPLFINPTTQLKFLETVWDWGLKEDFGDMCTVSRTIARKNHLTQKDKKKKYKINLRRICEIKYST